VRIFDKRFKYGLYFENIWYFLKFKNTLSNIKLQEHLLFLPEHFKNVWQPWYINMHGSDNFKSKNSHK